MSDLHHELARAAALAAATGGPCWHCGAPAPGRGDGGVARCLDAGACFARSVSPPPGPDARCLCGGRGYHGSPDEDDPIDVYCACEAGTMRWKRETGNEEEPIV